MFNILHVPHKYYRNIFFLIIPFAFFPIWFLPIEICNNFSSSIFINKYQIINNSNAPRDGSKRVVLKEDLIIPKKEIYKKNSIITDIHISTSGQIVTLDIDGNICILDPCGNLIRSMKVGNNISRINNYTSFEISNKDEIYVAELNRFLIYNSQGTLIKTIILQDSVIDFCIAPNGEIYAYVTTVGRSNEIVQYDQEGKQKKIFYNEVKPKLIYLKDSKGGTHLYSGVDHRYAWRLFFSPTSNGSAVFGNSGKYKLTLLDIRRADPMIIIKQESPEILKNDEIDETIRDLTEPNNISSGVISRKDILSAIKFPPHKPYFSILYGDIDGKIYAGRLIKDKIWSIDIFDKLGIFIESIQFDFVPIVKIINGKLYCRSKKSPSSITRYTMEIIK